VDNNTYFDRTIMLMKFKIHSPIRILCYRLLRYVANLAACQMDTNELADSALIFAPHPDDETLGCGGTIIKKKRAGAKIRVIFTTDGRHAQDLISEDGMKAIRVREAIAVARSLGLEENDVIFLEYEDTKLKENQEAALIKAIEILQKEQPTQVFIPYYKDILPDHIYTNRIVLSAIQACGRKAIVYEYPVWFWYHWPWVSISWYRQHQRHFLIRLKCNLMAGLRFLRDFHCFVYIGDVLKLKRTALEKYKSQMTQPIPNPHRPMLAEVSNGEFLQCFYQEREIFRRYCFDGKRK
jgi:LmbE family N-acetylglucosaminyl deacetylase